MKLSIVILNYKTKNLVRECLTNILALNLKLTHEIIVVDNNSQDGLEKMISEEFSEVKFFQTGENKGCGAGNNWGVKKAWGEYVLIINPDVVVLSNSIEKLVNFLDNNQKVGLIAPKLLYPNREDQPSRYRFPKFYMPVFIRTELGLLKKGKEKIGNYFMEDVKNNTPQAVDWVRGASFLMRRDLWQKINGFDERYFIYLEDTDLCRRVWLAGFEVWYLPEAEMIHYYFHESGSGTWRRDILNRLTWVHIVSWFKYFWKWREITTN
ncbi:MAG TPA: glycosyltransferase family 2 protein [bacterium]|nr:glycosyltransferase family 2 protein [bacterium]